MFEKFLKSFHSFEEDDIIYYELLHFLTAVFLLSSSPIREKAASIFDLYDVNSSNSFTKVELITCITRIIDVIFSYTESLLGNDEEKIQFHEGLLQKKERFFS